MAHCPKPTIQQHEYPSRHTSHSPVSTSSHQGQHAPTLRNDSIHSDADSTSQSLAAHFAQYTDAPPPYSEQQYRGKSEEQQTKMRMADYAKELKRLMGRQLVRGLKSGEGKGHL